MKKFSFDLFGKLFPVSGNEKTALLIDSSHMRKRAQGNSCHFLFVLLYGLAVAAALWQHGSPLFTLGALLLLVPAAFFVYVPYRVTDILLRRLFSCVVFIGSGFWMVYRLSKGMVPDLVFIEGLILCGFSFFVNCTKKDYAYIFLISLLLIMYAGLVPRRLLLYLIPGAAGCLLISFSVGRTQAFSGARRTVQLGPRPPLRNLGRTWHFYLLQILLAVPLFLAIFTLIPMQEVGQEGLLEVSFATSRTSVMPPDLRKWLLQDRKFIPGKYANYLFSGDDPEVPDREGKKKISADLPGWEDGSGRGAPPGKELVFTAVMPVKLYHLGTLYDVYDGKKWTTSPELAQGKLLPRRRGGLNRPFIIESDYTIQKWISPNLYAPFRPLDHTPKWENNVMQRPQWSRAKYKIRQSSFNAVLESGKDYPPLPFRYTVRSRLLVPVIPPPPGTKPSFPRITAPEIYTSAEEYFARIAEKENLRREKERIAAEKRAAAKKAAEEKRAAARRAAEKRAAEKRAAAKRAAEMRDSAKRNKNLQGAQKNTAKRQAAGKGTAKKSVVSQPPAKKTAVKKPLVPKPVKPPRPVIDPAWKLALPEAHFLRLPETLSPRIAELAKNITKNVHTPYEKAVALRDFLRSNYKYKLYAAPVPREKESVEYFLFELKEGHCEYFAAALTVLARCAGLPARVATGFSPGNYNALTRRIEVYEYHAHAWTQIFIANTGWLTFDAVPPAEIVSETTPAGIGRFRDPFGEEWRIMPPEMTPNTLQYVQKKLQEEAVRREAERLRREEYRRRQGTQLPQMKKPVQKKNLKKAPAKVRQVKPTGLKERLGKFIERHREKIREGLLRLLAVPEARNAVLVCFAAGIVIILFGRRTLKHLKHLYYRRRSKKLLARARRLEKDDPAQSVLCLYRAVRLLLILAGMERKKNTELLAYACEVRKDYSALLRKNRPAAPPEFLAEKSLRLEQGLKRIFNLFYALEYGSCPCSAADAAKCAQAAEEIRASLREQLPDSLLPAETSASE